MTRSSSADKWNLRYSSGEYIYGKEPNGFFKAFIGAHTPGRIFLPGEGEGRNAVYAAGKGWEVDALDYSEEGRKKAMKLANEMGVVINYTITDLEHVDCMERKYDAVGLFFVHLPVGLREKTHRLLINCLKPGGYLVLEAFNKRQIGNSTGGPNDISLLFSPDDLRSDFKSLHIHILEELVQHVESGIQHRGNAETIRLLAQKEAG